jgi:hypothetical protein
MCRSTPAEQALYARTAVREHAMPIMERIPRDHRTTIAVAATAPPLIDV